MCGSMADIQSAAAEIRRGKKKKEEERRRRRTNHSMKIYMVSLFHRATINKAIVDYTSPALCTPVTPLPPIGNAACRQRAGGERSHGHRQHAQKLVKIARVVPAIFSPPDRQTHRHTYSSQYFELIKIPKNTIYRRVAEFVIPLCTFMHMYF